MAAKTFLKSALTIFAILFLLAHLTFATPPRYEIIDLGTLGGNSGGANAINDVGQVVGWARTADGSSHAFLWDPTSGMIDLGTIPGHIYSSASAINDYGVVVGSSDPYGDQPYPFICDSSNGMRHLDGLSGEGGASGINNAKQVVGCVDDGSPHAFLWDNDRGAINLGTLGGWASFASAINNAGQVVGSADTPSLADHAFIWDNINGMRDLGTLGGRESIASGINDNGQVVGYSETTSDDVHAFFWDSEHGMIDLGHGPGDAINNAGQVVGGSFYWDSQSGVIRLDGLLPVSSRGKQLSAEYINNSGKIVGVDTTVRNEYRAFLMTPIPPKIIYVDDDATGANDGSSWADAFNYLQDALAAAYSGDEIRVAQGIYKPDQGGGQTPGDREATFQLINGVTIKGGYTGLGQPDPNERDIELYETILSGDLNGDDVDIRYAKELMDEPTRAENIYHVITGSGTDANAVLDGFTVIGGHANSSSPHSRGGGMYNYYGSPTLVDCIFTQNAALDGGGISNYSGNPTLNNCLFNDNGAFYSDLHHSGGIGGGMFNSESSPTVVNCTFSDGYAYNVAGGVYNSGGSPTFSNCEFDENRTWGGSGAGMYNKGSSPILSDCYFQENAHGVGGSGGGITNLWSDLVLTNCSFSFNQAPDGGGGMYNYDSSLILIDCNFVSNLAGYASIQDGGGIMNFQSTLTLTNCEFRSNKAGSSGGGIHNDDSVLTLTDCVFTNNEATAGGGMYNIYNSVVMLTDCAFTENEAGIGGGMYNNYDSNSTLINCIFSENSAYSQWSNSGSGGGMATGSGSNSTITNCLFTGNSAQYAGGAIHNWSGNCTLTNCIFSSNSAGYAGAVIYVYNGRYSSYSQTVNNCTFYDNLTPNGNALACDSYSQRYPGSVLITNSILWNEPNQIWNNDNSEITITYSDVRGGWPGDGNINADPQFINPLSYDYHLLSDSPCIDSGDPNFIAEPNETDLDGRPRVIGGRIDMGAYEYSPPISAAVRIVPRTINLQSKGKWIVAYIQLPEDYNVTDIDPNRIFLEDEIHPDEFSVDEQAQIATARFSREDVQAILDTGDNELTITGRLTDGTVFEAKNTIKVIKKAVRKWD